MDGFSTFLRKLLLVSKENRNYCCYNRNINNIGIMKQVEDPTCCCLSCNCLISNIRIFRSQVWV